MLFTLLTVTFDGQVKHLHREVVTSPNANQPHLYRSTSYRNRRNHSWLPSLGFEGLRSLKGRLACLSFDLEVGPANKQNNKNKNLRGHGILVKADSREDGSTLGRAIFPNSKVKARLLLWAQAVVRDSSSHIRK